MEGRLFVVSGPSGSGKSSIIAKILDLLDLEFSVSATTRAPRPGEINGSHYHFISRDAFEDMIERGELLEWAQYNNHLYGTPVAPINDATAKGRDILLDIEIQGARQVKENRPESIMVFIAPPNVAELERRLRHRGDTSEADIQDRLSIASHQLEVATELFDVVIVNDDLDEAIAELAKLITEPQ